MGEVRHAPGSIVVVMNKRVYAGAEFVEALTDAELEALILLARTNDQAGAIFERIKIVGMDFNEPRNVAIAGRMVTAGILTEARKNALTG